MTLDGTCENGRIGYQGMYVQLSSLGARVQTFMQGVPLTKLTLVMSIGCDASATGARYVQPLILGLSD